MKKNMKTNIKTYITYFDDNQIEEYGLKSDDDTILFKGNDTSYSGESINYLNVFYCELCTMYYVWKNNLKSDYVCFKQYRRPFNWQEANCMPKKGEVITFEAVPTYTTVIKQFALCHGQKRAYDLYYIIRVLFGCDTKIAQYFYKMNYMYTNNSMVLNWSDFCKMCEFVFPTLDKIDSFYGLHYKYEEYEKNAIEYTEDGKIDYQKHWMAYIGERLVSCFINSNLKTITIHRLPGQGFYEPYQHKDKKTK